MATRIPTEVPWSSPIKYIQHDLKPKPIFPNCKRILFLDEEEDEMFESSSDKAEPDYSSLSPVYGFNFLRIPMGQNANHFFDIRELVLEIETAIYEKKAEFLDIRSLRLRISAILTGSLPHSNKMGELGMILFYIDHPERAFPAEADSLIDYRALEIENEVSDLLKRHKPTDKRIPSGKTHYLLRAFAHMAMTSSQVYNRGGLYALLCILESPRYEVANYLRAEHHEHIVIVAKQILANAAFTGLFKRKISVHPDLQDAIRIDLKLSPGEPLHSIHVFWDCFMFLFHDIRQINRPNCYAIGALIYAIENAPYKTLEKMLSWLEGGHFVFNEQIGVPIAPLLEKRLVYTRDLQIELETEKALSLTTFKHIRSALKVSGLEKASSESDEAAPLHAVLSTIVRAEEETSRLPYAEQLYYAFKYNTLSHLALAVMEFAYLNCPKTDLKDQSYSAMKERFLDKIMQEIEQSLSHFPKEPAKKNLLQKIRKKLGEKLWFENCSEIDVHKKRDIVRVGAKEIRGFAGNLDSLVRVLEDSMRLFYLKGSDYALLENITDLQNAICETVDEAINDLRLERKQKYSSWTSDGVKRHIRSVGFAAGVAKYASALIKQKGISGYHLRSADLLLFEQTGGIPNEVLQRVLGLQVVIQRVSGAMTPYEFVRKLLSVLQGLDTSLFQATPRILAFSLGSHIWTLSPNRLRLLFNSSLTFYDFIQKTVFDSANAHMRKRIPYEVLKTVINRYTSNAELKSEIEDHFSGIRFLTYERVRSDFLDFATNYQLAKKVIDEEFGKLPKSQLDIKKIFQELKIRPNRETLLQIEKDLAKAPELIAPYQLALLLRELLILHKIAIKDPYEIEQAICAVHGLPIAFDIGDLNWDEGEDREDPPHPHLVIRYNWAERTLFFYHRESTGEFPTSKKEFERFEIQHPQVKPSVHNFW